MMKITYLGTTVLLFDDGKDQIIFDAYFSRFRILKANFGSLKTNEDIVNKVIREFQIDHLRAAFISHTHIDHVLDAPYLCQVTGAEFYGSESALNVARGGGIKDEHLHSYKHRQNYQIGDFNIEVIPAIHSKAHWYNNDLEKTIDKPFQQPAKKSQYKEGGSYDFIIHHIETTYIIHPSANYIPNQFDDRKADVLFLGIGALSKENDACRNQYYDETIHKLHPQLVIPIHWDDFFQPLYHTARGFPKFLDNSKKIMNEVNHYCVDNGSSFRIVYPLTNFDFEEKHKI